MKFFVIGILLLALAAHKASTECPENWIDLENLGCFYFATESESINWYDAQVFCNSLNQNAFLAEILFEETQIAISALANELPDGGWWLGGSDFYEVLILDF